MSALAKLRRQRRRFVFEYVACGIGTEAAVAAGFKGRRPDVKASKWLAEPDVKAAIEEVTAEAIAKSGVRLLRVLQEVAAVGQFNPKKLRKADGTLIPIHQLPDDVAAAICGEEFDAKGNLIKYRTHPKNEANRTLLQYLDALVERHEHTGKGGGPIETRDAGELTDLDKARRIAFLLSAGLRATTPLSEPRTPDSGDAGSIDDSPPAQATSRRLP